MIADWRPKNADIPADSGVYLFRDSEGRVIYVGKAKSLRSRVPSYFSSGLEIRASRMIDNAAAVEWIVTADEIEALQLEVMLIKKHTPRFNVRYRDDKSYPYLAVTLSEEIPRALVTRGKRKKGNRYYGPYAHAYAIRETLDLLLRVFPIRSCSPGVYQRAQRRGRPCLLYDISKCSGPCVGAVSPKEHLRIVQKFCDFMGGQHEQVLSELKEKMKAASEDQEYEMAARYRDQVGAVNKVAAETPWPGIADVDAVAFYGDELEAAFQVFFVRRGRLVGRKGFIVDRVELMNSGELVESFLERLYSEEQVPREVLVSSKPEDTDLLENWLSSQRDSKVRVRVPQRGVKKRILDTVKANAEQSLVQSRLKRSTDFAARSRALKDLQEALDLPEAPLRIECFDISNLGSTEAVGSMVVFEDALPRKQDYRKFKLEDFDGPDDVSAMGEVIYRRFRRYISEVAKAPEKSSKFAYRPGLVLIDGGKGQLNRTVEVLSSLGLVEISVAALAKRFEWVFMPGESDPRVVPRGSEALYLLQQIRDEAHRFAVEFQRVRSSKRTRQSVLDAIGGVGPERKRALLKHFGSTNRLREAGVGDIEEVEGIGPSLAKQIFEYLRSTG